MAQAPRSIKSRRKILEAAEDLVLERGPGNISIEAVAVRAGLSKGGVLYHFHTKADLLKALVAQHVETTRARTEAALEAGGGAPNVLAAALLDAYREERASPVPPASGVLAAVAEHPDFLDPLRAHHAETVARLGAHSADRDLAMIVFLALEGLKSLRLFGFDVLDRGGEDALLGRMEALLRTPAPE